MKKEILLTEKRRLIKEIENLKTEKLTLTTNINLLQQQLETIKKQKEYIDKLEQKTFRLSQLFLVENYSNNFYFCTYSEKAVTKNFEYSNSSQSEIIKNLNDIFTGNLIITKTINNNNSNENETYLEKTKNFYSSDFKIIPLEEEYPILKQFNETIPYEILKQLHSDRIYKNSDYILDSVEKNYTLKRKK